MNYIFMLGSCLVFSIILIIIFRLKTQKYDGETLIYSILGFANCIGISLEMESIYLSIYEPSSLFCRIVLRLYFSYIVIFNTLLLCYVFDIYKTEFNSKKYSILKYLVVFFSFGFIVFNCFLPYECFPGYATGTAVKAIYIYSVFCFGTLLVSMVVNRKNLRIKKIFPILFMSFIKGLLSLLQRNYPDMTISTAVDFLVVFLMFHTIENPDLRIAELEKKAASAADKANRAKSEFLSSMSHEIRTPLNAIIGFSEFILETDDINEAHNQAKDVINASQILLETVNGILDISKVEAGKLEIVEDNYNLMELLDNTVKMAKARLGDKPLDFRVHFAPDLPDSLYGDKGNIQKVLINLLTNAIKYTNEGYIDYSVQCTKTDNHCRLIITVKDSGIGIKKENIDKLFTRFQRFDEKNNGTIEGTGLGLAITKQLVEMMGGNIVVSSIYGEGSNFTVALDQKLSLTHVAPKTTITDSPVGIDFSNKKVLVVDDNNLNLKLAERLFLKYNCHIKTVKSGFECLDLITAGNKFDLIFLDDVMPKMLGSETLVRLKKTEGFNTPVVALTANAVSGMREKYLLLGFDDYLAKPIERNELDVILKKYLLENAKAKGLGAEALTSSKPIAVIDQGVKDAILSSPSSKDVVLAEKETVKTVIKEKAKEDTPVTPSVTSTEISSVAIAPLTPVNNAQASEGGNETFTDYSNRRILVVDDNKLNLKVALKFLSRYKFQTDEAYSGQECIDKVKAGNHYDIIFMDIMMPNMSGVETFHELQRIEGFSVPVVVALTADAVDGAQERYLGEGFAEYISKPIVRERLDKVIHEILDKK